MQDGGECGGGGVGGTRNGYVYLRNIFCRNNLDDGWPCDDHIVKKEWNRISTIYILPKYFCYWKAWLFVGAEAIAWFSILNRISTIYISLKYLGSGFSKFYLRQCPLPTSRNTSSV